MWIAFMLIILGCLVNLFLHVLGEISYLSFIFLFNHSEIKTLKRIQVTPNNTDVVYFKVR